MIYTPSFTAFQGIFILLLGILTFFPTYVFSHQVVRGDISHKRLIKRFEPSNSADQSKRESFVPRDHFKSHKATRAFPVDGNNDSSLHPISAATWNGPGQYKLKGTSGVSAMQMSVVDNRYVIIFDKAEHNPLKTSDGNNAWSALYDSSAHTVRALKLVTNSFCAGELCNSCYVLQFGRVGVLISVDYRRRVAWQRHLDRLWRQPKRKHPQWKRENGYSIIYTKAKWRRSSFRRSCQCSFDFKQASSSVQQSKW